MESGFRAEGISCAHALTSHQSLKSLFFRSVLYFLLFIVGAHLQASAQTSPLSFTVIPFSNPDLIAQDRGAEHWMQSDANFDGVNNVYLPSSTGTRTLNYYKRINWAQIENAGSGTTPAATRWNWTVFDQEIHNAIDHGQRFSFGILNMAEGYPAYGSPGGAALSYPTWLHNKMQTETTKDWISPTGDWVPDYNSPSYLQALDDLNNAIANHINTTTYKGVRYQDVIFCVDIRGFGNFGEWHNSPWYDAMKTAGRLPTIASYKRIIDSHKNAFPDFQLVCIMNAFDVTAGGSTEIPAEIAYYVLSQQNNRGLYGWRRDNWGASWYDTECLRDNPCVYNGWHADTAIMNRYKYAPITGEPYNGSLATVNGVPYGDVPREVRLYHANSFGNNNYFLNVSTSASMQDSIRMASKLCGYRLQLDGGSMTTTLSPGMPFSISLNWHNVGLAPVYINWNVTFELRNASNTAVWTGNSSFRPRLFQPAASASSITDNFTLPAGIAAGNYTMVLVIRDPNGYTAPLVLAINGRQTDGSYPLRAVTVAAAVNQVPIANAGNDTTTFSSTATLNGSASRDPDGTIVSYKWTEVSGPSIYTISNPNAATPSLSGLLLGNYLFQLEVTDNAGATARDTVLVVSEPTALSVQWEYFRVSNSGGKNLLTWATSKEVNNDHFEIEKSYDGTHFITLGSVAAAGNSQQTVSYQYADNDPGTAPLYYRIRQVSRSGAYAYSTIVILQPAADGASVHVFPNPAVNNIQVRLFGQLNGPLQCRLYSIDGKLLKEESLPALDGQKQISISLANLKSGMYLLVIHSADEIKAVTKVFKE